MLRCAPRARPAPAARPFPFLGLGRGPISPAFSPLRTGIPRDPSFFVGCGEQKGQVQSDTQSSPRRAITSRSTRDCRPASTSTRTTSGLRRCCLYGIYSGLRTATYDNFGNAPHFRWNDVVPRLHNYTSTFDTSPVHGSVLKLPFPLRWYHYATIPPLWR